MFSQKKVLESRLSLYRTAIRRYDLDLQKLQEGDREYERIVQKKAEMLRLIEQVTDYIERHRHHQNFDF